MLTIRKEQMQLLETAMQRAFVERLARAMASCFPDYFLAVPVANRDEAYRDLTRKVIGRAERFGIDREGDIAAFVVLAMAARSFADAAHGILNWTHPIILDKAIAGAAKIPLIEHRLKRDAAADPCAARVAEMFRMVRAGK